MRKEIVLAIIFGAILGLVVTYGMYTANKAIITKQTGINPQTTTIPAPTPAPEETVSLRLDNEDTNSVVTTSKYIISGKTNPDNIVAILTEDDQLMVTADKDGLFSQTIELIKGANTIQVSASDSIHVTPTQTLQIVYTTDLTE